MAQTTATTALFPLGQLVATPPAIDLMIANGISPARLLDRHQSGDWGDLGNEDRRANDEAVRIGERIFSAYGEGDARLWVITESDRSATTILRPEDY